jgi:hypothetical protein
MTSPQTASQRITEEVVSWPGVEAGAGRRGAFAFKVGRREIGHPHGDHAARFSFPKRVWAELMEQGRIVPHPVFPDQPGPAARRIEDEGDVRDVIRLLRLNYDRALARHGLPAKARAWWPSPPTWSCPMPPPPRPGTQRPSVPKSRAASRCPAARS